MTITSKLNLDLVLRGVTSVVNAVQGDANTRAVAATLTADGKAWNPPADAAVSVAFQNRSTGHKGRYDKLPDGSDACSVKDNVVTAILAPAVLAAPGEVQVAIVFEDGELNRLASFSFRIVVEANMAAAEPVTEDYYNYAPGNIDDSSVGTKAWSSQRIMEELEPIWGAVAGLTQGLKERAGVIECTASGTAISVADASDSPLRGLTVYGKTTQNGTPTPDAPVALESAGDSGKVEIRLLGNLLNVDAMLNNNLVKNADGSYTMTRTGTDSADRFSKWFNTNLPAGNYKISASLVQTNTNVGTGYLFLHVKYADGTYSSYRILQEGWSHQYLNFTQAVTALRLMVSGSEAVGTYCTFRDLQLDASNSAAPYFPYIEPQVLSVNTPSGLPGIPVTSGGNYTDENGQQWICDEVDLARGVYVQRIARVTFDGSTDEKWNYNNMVDTSGFIINQHIISCNVLSMSPVISTHYPGAKFADRKKKYGIVYTYNSGIGISVSPDVASSTGEWQAVLAENPVTVQYVLAEPIETTLTAAEIAAYKALHTNKPNTVVLNDAGAGMAVSYVADTKTYIDNKIYEVAAAIISK